jgi:uroporphyrinogen decarboxylase
MWAMRQAGRYLPEFLALRNYNFLERVHTPELAAEITLQPLRRYRKQLDAVVIFSDILIVPPAMGIPVAFRPGPQFGRLLETPADLDSLNFKPDIGQAFAFLFEAIALTRKLAAAPQGAPFDVEAFRREYGAGPVPAAAATAKEGCPSAGNDRYRLPRAALHAELLADIATGATSAGKAVPVIGFVGAPWTLMSYMIDGDLAHAAPAAAAAATAPAAASETPSAAPAAHDASSAQPLESATAAATAGGAGSAGAATLAGGKAGERGLVGHKTYERSKRWLYHVSARFVNAGGGACHSRMD